MNSIGKWLLVGAAAWGAHALWQRQRRYRVAASDRRSPPLLRDSQPRRDDTMQVNETSAGTDASLSAAGGTL